MALMIPLDNELKSKQIAHQLARCITEITALTLTFSGVIGAGKTTFIRAFLQQLGVQGTIKSPSYSLVESYMTSTLTIHHFDLYRIADDSELDYIGFRDYFNEAICCVEWPERLNTLIIPCDLHLTISVQEPGRMLVLNSYTTLGSNLSARLMALQ